MTRQVVGRGWRLARDRRDEYLGNYPNARHSGWSEELQGVTHDDGNWYFTQKGALWKFPVSHDLNERVTEANPAKGILRTRIPTVLRDHGYNHFGDLDHHRGHLFVPVEGGSMPVIAIFRAAD